MQIAVYLYRSQPPSGAMESMRVLHVEMKNGSCFDPIHSVDAITPGAFRSCRGNI